MGKPRAQISNVDELKKMYLSGSHLYELATYSGFDKRTVRRCLVEAGCVIRKGTEGRPRIQRTKSKMDAMYESGKSLKEIGRTVGHSAGWVRKRLTCKVRGRGWHEGYQNATGPRNARWIDGRSYTPYPKEWTRKLCVTVRREQGNRCGDCNKKHRAIRAMHVHHIDEDKQNCERDNLIALCNKCHKKRHGKA